MSRQPSRAASATNSTELRDIEPSSCSIPRSANEWDSTFADYRNDLFRHFALHLLGQSWRRGLNILHNDDLQITEELLLVFPSHSWLP
jgi:hypothetical protein